MGDLSREPSMEEILSSIKRIIAEEGEEAAKAATKAPARTRGEARSAPKPEIADESDEILELTDPLADPVAGALHADIAPETEAPESAVLSNPASATDDGILSVASEVSARLSLAALSTMLVKPQPGEENTLEGLVRTMLRPMLKEWLDARLPGIVEDMVAKEISRITGR